MADVWAHGDAYERFMGRWSRLVAPRFLDWLACPPGLRWVDVGCGTGALTAEILTRASPTSVHGVDPAPSQVAEASRRIRDRRVSFATGTAEDLPGDSYDVAVAGLVLNFVPDPLVTATSMARAARGGVVAAFVWDYAEGMQLLRSFWDTAAALDPTVVGLHEGHRSQLPGTDALLDLWAAAGLGDLAATTLTVQTVFEDFDDYWLPFLGGQGPAPAYVTSLDDTRREELRAALRERLPADREGAIHLSARAWAVRGLS